MLPDERATSVLLSGIVILIFELAEVVVMLSSVVSGLYNKGTVRDVWIGISSANFILVVSSPICS